MRYRRVRGQTMGDSMDGPDTPAATVRDYDNRHYMHPWDSIGDTAPADRTIAARAEGIHVYDQHGRRLIDGPGGMWCTQIGYGRREMAEAIAEQVLALSYYSPWNTTSAPASVLAHRLATLAPGDLNTVFFTTGGSTAVDSAIRFMHLRNNHLGRPDKKIVLAHEKGYHGSTYLAASLTGRTRGRNLLDATATPVQFLPDISPSARPAAMTLDDWCAGKVADLQQAITDLGADRIGAVISEPVLASGGVIVPPPGYHQQVRALCRAHDILYIADEVVTGFGRLGHWFASEAVFGVVPDIITCAKGLTSGYLPLGACLISDRLIDEIRAAGGEAPTYGNGYTYSGHPVACAAALKNIEIMEREQVLQHVRAVAPHFQARLAALAGKPAVGEVRGIGLVGCVEGQAAGRATLSADAALALDRKFGALVDRRCEQLGLIVRPLINMCVLSPPLIITTAEIDTMVDILAQAIDDVTDRARAPAA